MQTGVSRHSDGEAPPAAEPRKFYVEPADFEVAQPPSPVGVADSPVEDSAGDSGDSCNGDDAAAEGGEREANLTISTGVKGGLKLHERSGDSPVDSPTMSRQNRCGCTICLQGVICFGMRGRGG